MLNTCLVAMLREGLERTLVSAEYASHTLEQQQQQQKP